MSEWREHALAPKTVLEHWGSDAGRGLSEDVAAERLQKFGPNRLEEIGRVSPWRQFASQFTEFIILVLIGAAFISGILQEWTDAIAILVIVLLNGILGFVQQYRAERALEALKKMAAPLARVIRQREVRSIPAEELVPGDIIALEMGDLVPADARVLSDHLLQVDEASLTGESVPVKKDADVVLPDDAPLGDRRNMVYSSTVVTYGKGTAVVTNTGMDTELGKIAHLVQTMGREQTPLQEQLEVVGRLLVYGCLLIVAVVFALGLWRGVPPVEMFLTAVSLAVAAIPEGLPAVVTIALALGVRRMVQRNALIRKLPSVETLGSATVICTDKTGTLTQSKMTVRKIGLLDSIIDVTGDGYDPEGEFRIGDQPVEGANRDLELALRIGVLCNNASLRQEVGDGSGWGIVGDPTEGALLAVAGKAGLWRSELETGHTMVYELPFDSDRKRMTTIWRGPDGGTTAYVKGAPDVVVRLCTHVQDNGRVRAATSEDRERLLAVNDGFANEAMRVLAVAYRDLEEVTDPTIAEVERQLVFSALMAMKDPPRPEAREAIATARRAGLEVVMITGDHKSTAVAIAKELDLYRDGDLAFTGPELDGIDDGRLREIVEQVRVYARVSPEHKLRIVGAWKSRGHIVAMTGDGVNDAPALKEADIGIAMGITGTDVSKEASDMILTDDNFASIVAAVEEGRAIFDNIRRFIHFLLSCNIGELLTMLLASLLGLPLPLLPIQILWVNLATDSLPALALGVEPAEPRGMERPPRPPTEGVLTKRIASIMLMQGTIIGLLTLGAFLFEYLVMGGGVDRARVIAFSTTIFAQNVHAFNVRSDRYSVFQLGLLSNPWLLVSFGVVIVSELAVIYVPFLQPIFKTMPLGAQDWAVVIGLGVMPLVIVEFIKLINRRLGRV
ncbi:MAG TPA: cation-translocating P-type ATPase [Anaerolineae bacterium]|nr:cation-translocating P-type ATPase [Anaerolineae bacterium]